MQKTSTVAEAIIKPNDRLTSFERLEIYNRQYWFRISIASTMIILACAPSSVIGNLNRLARAYLTRYPS